MKKYISLISFILIGIFTVFFFWKTSVETPLSLREVSFKALPGWDKTNVKRSFSAFRRSCKTFLRQAPERWAGSQHIAFQMKEWQPACQAAITLEPVNNEQARAFFQTWFRPVEFYEDRPVDGLFTGYYSPLLKGSLTRTPKYNVPLYALPKNLVTAHLGQFDKKLEHRRVIGQVHKNQLLPYHARKDINSGALKDNAEVIVWVDNPVDRQFLEIQGSGIVELEDGQRINVGYAGENGQPYTSLAKILIDKGVMTKDNASMQGIKRYLESHPEEKKKILNQNKSFVFFEKTVQNEAYGAQGIALTPGYSLAIDRKYVPMGAPVWLDTSSPGLHSDSENTLQRLMIAQDTGGAIKGAVRGDVYWGAGEKATYIAGHMKNKGHYWLLLPKQIVAGLPH